MPRALCRCGSSLDASKPLSGTVRLGLAASDSGRLRGYDPCMSVDPLISALEEVAPKLNPELERVMAALRAGEPVEDAWEALLQEILDEA
jgi:hypothetical protein